MELHKEVLTKPAYKILKEIMQNPNLSDFYLVGGTAIALYIGHRKSIDLDFFTQKEFKSPIINSIHKKKNILSLNDNSIEFSIDDTKLFLMYFAFPLLKKVREINLIRIANPIDLGLMKLLSLQGRSTKKDIIDLYFIDKEIISLEKLLNLFEKHYPKESFNSYNSLKDLMNKEYLKNDKMPYLIKGIDWDFALQMVQNKVLQHIRQLIK